MRFMCQETLDHLAFLKEKVKDVEGFWASTLVGPLPPSLVISIRREERKEADMRDS